MAVGLPEGVTEAMLGGTEFEEAEAAVSTEVDFALLDAGIQPQSCSVRDLLIEEAVDDVCYRLWEPEAAAKRVVDDYLRMLDEEEETDETA